MLKRELFFFTQHIALQLIVGNDINSTLTQISLEAFRDPIPEPNASSFGATKKSKQKSGIDSTSVSYADPLSAQFPPPNPVATNSNSLQ